MYIKLLESSGNFLQISPIIYFHYWRVTPRICETAGFETSKIFNDCIYFRLLL